MGAVCIHLNVDVSGWSLSLIFKSALGACLAWKLQNALLNGIDIVDNTICMLGTFVILVQEGHSHGWDFLEHSVGLSQSSVYPSGFHSQW